ncbi:hypothetical protein CBER1_11640 [Cercospora berteroae]|uniref:Uncharacterized protein n=1 Tax=Cercospora berteroae TaxID=357750 RepID=A0A2S6CM80_9PEZI|nr:hypothetical protein CBER1_11640 [Cercospora berteroae]
MKHVQTSEVLVDSSIPAPAPASPMDEVNCPRAEHRAGQEEGSKPPLQQDRPEVHADVTTCAGSWPPAEMSKAGECLRSSSRENARRNDAGPETSHSVAELSATDEMVEDDFEDLMAGRAHRDEEDAATLRQEEAEVACRTAEDLTRNSLQMQHEQPGAATKTENAYALAKLTGRERADDKSRQDRKYRRLRQHKEQRVQRNSKARRNRFTSHGQVAAWLQQQRLTKWPSSTRPAAPEAVGHRVGERDVAHSASSLESMPQPATEKLKIWDATNNGSQQDRHMPEHPDLPRATAEAESAAPQSTSLKRLTQWPKGDIIDVENDSTEAFVATAHKDERPPGTGHNIASGAPTAPARATVESLPQRRVENSEQRSTVEEHGEDRPQINTSAQGGNRATTLPSVGPRGGTSQNNTAIDSSDRLVTPAIAKSSANPKRKRNEDEPNNMAVDIRLLGERHSFGVSDRDPFEPQVNYMRDIWSSVDHSRIFITSEVDIPELASNQYANHNRVWSWADQDYRAFQDSLRPLPKKGYHFHLVSSERHPEPFHYCTVGIEGCWINLTQKDVRNYWIAVLSRRQWTSPGKIRRTGME